MALTSSPFRRPFRVAGLFLLTAVVFAAVYGQAPLYYSNQNQYFLHGLADAETGLLRDDWLANTQDPTPVFSAVVAFTVRFLHPAAFYVYYGLLFGVYALAMLGLFATVAGPQTAARRWPIFAALFLLVHSALARWCSYRWLGFDYPWFLQAGVAGQYVLGAVLQPSAFGVLLVAAVCLFVRGQPFPAAVCAALAATFHSTYLLPAGLLTLGFLTALVLESRSRQALALGALSFALVLPVMVHVLTRFGPTSPETFAEAQRILVNVRIPHHTQPAIWLDWIGGLQVGWMALGILLARPLRLRVSLAVPFALSALLTLAQVATGSDTLALLFPWRVSSVLMPIATAVILSRLVVVPVPQLNGLAARWASGVAVLALVVAGPWLLTARQGFHSPDDELPLLDYVRANKAPGDVYFLPVAEPPTPPKHSGSLSTDFMPVPDKRRDGRPIPVNLQRFRLYTGAPIYVDFKAVPYKDSDVLEWHDRLRRAEDLQKRLREGHWSEVLAELRRLGVTHLIVQPGQGPPPLGAEPLFGDSNYLLYRLNTPPSGD